MKRPTEDIEVADAAMAGDRETGEKGRRLKRNVLIFMSIGILVPGGYGFIEKFIQFIRTLATDAEGGFTIIPITNYLIVGLGMTCLLVWATAQGMFRNVEEPKYTMLQQEEMLENALKKARTEE